MKSEIRELTGICHIALTPFDNNEQIDFASIERIVQTAIQAGCQGVVPLAIMGEAHKLLENERDRVLEAYVKAAGDSLHVIAGITSESTVVAVDRAQRAMDLGATAVMMAPARDLAAGQILVEHYAAVCNRVDLAMVVQDEPVTTGVKLPAEIFSQLAKIDNVFAVKVEEAPSPPKISAILRSAPNLLCFGGLGGVSLYEELRRGAVGTMTGFAFPELLVQIWTHYLKGDRDLAREVFHRYLPLIRFEAQLGVGGVAIRKQLFYERGIIADPLVRRPTAEIEPETVEELRELIDVLGLEGRHA